jgi:hypothetical protein
MSIAIRIWEVPDGVCCRMVVPLVARIGGSITLTVKLTSARVLACLKAAGISFSKEEIGSLFGGIGKALKKISKISILKKALALGKALVNSPLGSLIAPGAAQAIAAASGAAKLIAASKGSDPNKAKKAKLALAAAAAQAKIETQAGHQLPLPSGMQARSDESKAAFRYLVTVNRAAA